MAGAALGTLAQEHGGKRGEQSSACRDACYGEAKVVKDVRSGGRDLLLQGPDGKEVNASTGTYEEERKSGGEVN